MASPLFKCTLKSDEPKKSRDSFAILATLDPAKVRKASCYAKRLLKHLGA